MKYSTEEYIEKLSGNSFEYLFLKGYAESFEKETQADQLRILQHKNMKWAVLINLYTYTPKVLYGLISLEHSSNRRLSRSRSFSFM
ncbi:MAG TPA: hypothetical protein VHZ76_04910 [Gammaproteobacteria bacterium]|jgi:hypothetical protein|nr:hypothetical protein [Gammaproteobacteria bacterium]